MVFSTDRDELDALGRELFGSWFVYVAGDAADFEFFGQDWICEDGFDDGASLVACGAKDGDDLGHGEIVCK